MRIFHEYGDLRHFLSLFYLKEKYQAVDRLDYITFDPMKVIYKTLKNLDIKYFTGNITMLLRTLMEANNMINIVGMAPLHYFVYYFRKLRHKRKPMIYFTSWPYWDFGNEQNPWVHRLPDLRREWLSFVQEVDAVVCVTNTACKALENFSSNVFHIPHSVDTEIFKPIKSSKDNEKIKILYVGRLTIEKGIKHLIEVIIKGAWKNIEFWFVGSGKLSRLIKSLEQKYPVRYFGYVSDQKILAKIYQISDILVLPTISEELFGIVLIEAMACGLPTIATNTIGPMEIIKNGTTGIVIPKGDIKALKNAIEMLIQDETLRRKMGMNGREEAIKKYDVAVVSKQWMKVIEKVLK
ncbi:MAG: glycosyltransferase family 4 protein [Ignisphaera sp.]